VIASPRRTVHLRAARDTGRDAAALVALVTLAAALAALLGACAPRPPAPALLDTRSVSARYRSDLLARESLGQALDADARIWLGGSAFEQRPALSATLALGAPDGCRLRVGSLFGVALDVAARGDTVTALVPGRRLALEVNAAGDTLGVADPGALAYRVWSAAWRPPDSAWDTARADSVLRVRWSESDDRLELSVDATGRPLEVRLSRPGGPNVACRYRGWESVGGVPWPSWIEFEDDAGTVHVECRVSQMRARRGAARERLVVHIPDGVERLVWSELRAALERPGGS
jgi:hypothetical protein